MIKKILLLSFFVCAGHCITPNISVTLKSNLKISGELVRIGDYSDEVYFYVLNESILYKFKKAEVLSIYYKTSKISREKYSLIKSRFVGMSEFDSIINPLNDSLKISVSNPDSLFILAGGSLKRAQNLSIGGFILEIVGSAIIASSANAKTTKSTIWIGAGLSLTGLFLSLASFSSIGDAGEYLRSYPVHTNSEGPSP